MTTTPTLLSPFAYYVRKSDDKSDLRRQIRNIESFAKEGNFVIPKHLRYHDTGSRDKSDKREQT